MEDVFYAFNFEVFQLFINPSLNYIAHHDKYSK